MCLVHNISASDKTVQPDKIHYECATDMDPFRLVVLCSVIPVFNMLHRSVPYVESK